MKYIDTDVFVYWATDHPEHGQRATEILRHVELNEKAVTSALSFWIFNNIMRGHQGYSLKQFLDQVRRMRNLKIVPLDEEVLGAAGELIRDRNLSPEVAVAAVVAKKKGADTVHSTNPEFDRTGLKRVF